MKAIFEEIVSLIADLRTLGVIIQDDTIGYSFDERFKKHVICIKRLKNSLKSINLENANTIRGLFNNKFKELQPAFEYEEFAPRESALLNFHLNEHDYHEHEKNDIDGFLFKCIIFER